MLQIHSGAITAIVVIKCFIFTASIDKTIKVWDRDGKQVCQLSGGIKTIQFNVITQIRPLGANGNTII
jgi:WD40 repeat protein